MLALKNINSQIYLVTKCLESSIAITGISDVRKSNKSFYFGRRHWKC